MDQDRERAKELYSKMNLWEKAVYLVQNYWKPAFFLIVGVGVVLSIIGQMTWNRSPKSALGVGIHAKMFELNETDDFNSYLTETYPEFLTKKSAFYGYWFYNGYSNDQVELIQSTTYQLVGAVAAGQLDVMVGDRESLEGDVSLQYCRDLSELFNEEELALIEELASAHASDGIGIVPVTYSVTGDTGRTVDKYEDIPSLIAITGCDPKLDEIMMGQEVYLAVIVNEGRENQAKAFIWTLLGENDRAKACLSAE